MNDTADINVNSYTDSDINFDSDYINEESNKSDSNTDEFIFSKSEEKTNISINIKYTADSVESDYISDTIFNNEIDELDHFIDDITDNEYDKSSEETDVMI